MLINSSHGWIAKCLTLFIKSVILLTHVSLHSLEFQIVHKRNCFRLLFQQSPFECLSESLNVLPPYIWNYRFSFCMLIQLVEIEFFSTTVLSVVWWIALNPSSSFRRWNSFTIWWIVWSEWPQSHAGLSLKFHLWRCCDVLAWRVWILLAQTTVSRGGRNLEALLSDHSPGLC